MEKRSFGLVTLSGCSSGAGASYSGLGLFGLTRAWLRSGTSTVVASHWPMPDGDGQLLSRMYSHLQSTGPESHPIDVAQALRAAQKEMRSAGGWRSRPAYWAGFFVVGKE